MPVSGGSALLACGFLDGSAVGANSHGFMGVEQACQVFPKAIHYLFTAHNPCRGRTPVHIEPQRSIADPYSNAFLSFYVASLIFWTLIVPFLLKSKYAIKNPLLLALTGWLVLLPTSFALYQLRAIDPLLLLGFMATVWISDTAAYFIGRAFGKHKLAPNISPGKTWEGVAGALVVVFVYALIWSHFAGQEVQPKFLMPLLLVIVVMGIVGDLFESLMKGRRGLRTVAIFCRATVVYLIALMH